MGTKTYVDRTVHYENLSSDDLRAIAHEFRLDAMPSDEVLRRLGPGTVVPQKQLSLVGIVGTGSNRHASDGPTGPPEPLLNWIKRLWHSTFSKRQP